MKNRRKKNLAFIITLIFMLLGIGYAYLTTNLKINGATGIDRNHWDVYFDNIQVSNGSVTGDQVIDTPEIDALETTVSFHVRLKKPGDYYEFTVDAKNDGNIDAMINTVVKKLNGTEIVSLPPYINFTVTYSDGAKIMSPQLLAAETVETYRVRVEYRTDINPEDLPTTAQSLNLSFSVEYIQAGGNYIKVYGDVYNISPIMFDIDGTIPSSIQLYNSYQDAVSAFGNQFFLKHNIAGNRVLESYVGFIYNGYVYYLRGGGATFNQATNSYNNDSPYYESNRAILQSIIPTEKCHSGENDYYCTDVDANLIIEVVENGDVIVFDSDYDWACIINDNKCGCSNNYG